MGMMPYGFIASYVHSEGRVGVLVRLECTDSFTARTEEFRLLAHDLALHIAAAEPVSVAFHDLDPRIWEEELERVRPALASSTPTERVRILGEARNKFEEQRCLLNQKFVKDPGKTIGALIRELSEKTKDEIRVGGFSRYEVAI